jgi:hypothetical protein
MTNPNKWIEAEEAYEFMDIMYYLIVCSECHSVRANYFIESRWGPETVLCKQCLDKLLDNNEFPFSQEVRIIYLAPENLPKGVFQELYETFRVKK